MRNLIQGYFKPKHPEKYRGDPTKICFRSSWERVLCKFFDENPLVVQWASEELVVPYYDQATQKQRRYFPDFLVKFKRGESLYETVMVEVKPYDQTQPPRQPKRVTKKTQARLLEETETYITNQCKWEAAREFCAQRGWKFMIMTEKEIFGGRAP